MDSFLRAFHKPLLTLVTAVFNYIKLQIFISKFTPQLTKITGIYRSSFSFQTDSYYVLNFMLLKLVSLIHSRALKL